MKFIDLFAGVGGFRLGMERVGHECVWSCEIDRWAQAVYRHHWGQVKAGDARRVDPAEIPDFDVLCAGFPCQSFSLAGKRGGLKDARGTLFYEICRIARVKRPQVLLLENVKGLLSADDRLAFKVILESMGELGYDAEWQVLNSKGFGVPQNRPRVFIIGHLGGIRGREVFPILKDGGDSAEGDEKTEGGQIANTLSGESAGGQNARGNYAVIRWQNKREGAVMDDTAPSLRASGGTDIRKRPAVIAEGKLVILDDTEIGAKSIYLMPAVKHKLPFMGSAPKPKDIKTEPSFPLQTGGGYDLAIQTGKSTKQAEKDGDKNIYAGYTRIRCLTPRECERLQGFPDDWTRWGLDEDGRKIEISDTQRYKMMGNAVTVNVVEFIARRIK